MSYKDEIKKELQRILNYPNFTPNKLYIYIENLYIKVIYESKKTGQSIESATYEILEALEESYKIYPNEIENILDKCSQIMIEIIHTSALQSLEKKNQKIIQAKIQLIETLEAEKSYLLVTLDTLKEYADEHTHSNLQKSLQQTESDIIKRIYTLVEQIKYYIKAENQGNS